MLVLMPSSGSGASALNIFKHRFRFKDVSQAFPDKLEALPGLDHNFPTCG